MSAHAAPAAGGPSLTIRGTAYPVLLPKLRDPRLHLAATITSLQVIGQVGFHFQALDRPDPRSRSARARCSRSRSRCGSQHVILWPASALLTGNGVAFVLRVPGTAHGDWWSLRGWWIFVGDGRGLAALEARDRVARRARLQPVEHRARRLLPRARPDARRRRSTSGGGRCRGGSCSRSRSSSPAASRSSARLQLLADRARLLALVRRRDRRARARRPRDDARAGTSARSRASILVGARHLAGGARLPLLHDHRPEDGAARRARAARRTRVVARAARRDADRADDDRVRGQGRAARRRSRSSARRCRCCGAFRSRVDRRRASSGPPRGRRLRGRRRVLRDAARGAVRPLPPGACRRSRSCRRTACRRSSTCTRRS